MKKYISLILICFIFTAALSACGDQKKEEASKGEENTEEIAEVSENESEPEASEETAEEAESEAEQDELAAEFEPNTEYDRYALVDYTVEDIEAHFVATVSAREDGSEYELHCNMDGEEQILVLDKDLNIVSDLTGNMSYDAPLIVQKAIDADEWVQIDQ